MNRSFLIFTASVALLGLWMTSSISAFQERVEEVPGPLTIISPPEAPVAATFDRAVGLARTRSNTSPMKAAMKALKEAESNDEKQEAEDQIREILEVQYDDFLEANKKQIEELQTRLDNLKEQLERRRRAKSKMVDLEMQRVVNETEGLIWPSQNGRNSRTLYRGFPAPAPTWSSSKDPFAEVPRFRENQNSRTRNLRSTVRSKNTGR